MTNSGDDSGGNAGNGIKSNAGAIPVKKLIIVDTNVLIADPSAVYYLSKNNFLCIPRIVLTELDRVKKDPGVGEEAREALRQIEKAGREEITDLKIITGMDWSGLSFSEDPSVKNYGDHQILAAINHIKKTYAERLGKKDGYSVIHFYTNDHYLSCLSRAMFPEIKAGAFYPKNFKKASNDAVAAIRQKIPTVLINEEEFVDPEFKYAEKRDGNIGTNEAVIFQIITPRKKAPAHLMVRAGSGYVEVPSDLTIAGVKPLIIENNGENNFSQLLAAFYLQKEAPECVFLLGDMGSGKTHLSLAAAINSLAINRQKMIIATSRLVEEGNGSAAAKNALLFQPLTNALEKICSGKSAKLLPNKEKISYLSLDTVLRMDLCETFLIVENAEKLSQLLIKRILRRASEKTKIVFNGTIIDHDYQRAGGLIYSMSKLKDHPAVAACYLDAPPLSRLAKLAENII